MMAVALGTCSPASAGDILLADRAYDSERCVRVDRSAGSLGQYQADAQPGERSRFQRFLYRYRNLVERFFSKLKHFRAIATASRSTPPIISPWSNSVQSIAVD